MKFEIQLGISARHCHVTQQALEAMFGVGAKLHVKKPIKQPRQFAAEEQVTAVFPKGEMKLRILGPVRSYNQVELAYTDARKAGVNPPIRKSGDLKGSPGCILRGPYGEVVMKQGVIVAERHVHLFPETAAKYFLKEDDMVQIITLGRRATVLDNVRVRCGPNDGDEVHLDTDEGNCIDMQNGQMITILANEDKHNFLWTPGTNPAWAHGEGPTLEPPADELHEAPHY